MIEIILQAVFIVGIIIAYVIYKIIGNKDKRKND